MSVIKANPQVAQLLLTGPNLFIAQPRKLLPWNLAKRGHDFHIGIVADFRRRVCSGVEVISFASRLRTASLCWISFSESKSIGIKSVRPARDRLHIDDNIRVEAGET